MANHETQVEKRGSPWWQKLIVGVVIIVIGAVLNTPSTTIGIIELNPGVTIAMIGVLIALFPVIESFYVKPLGDAIDERNSNLERTFGEAEALRTEMTQLKADYERRLQQTEAEAREQIQAQIREAQQLRQALMTEAADKADALVKEAQVRIEAERNQIVNEIRLQVVDLTLAAAGKVIGENMDSDKNRRIVSEFIDQVEVAR